TLSTVLGGRFGRGLIGVLRGVIAREGRTQPSPRAFRARAEAGGRDGGFLGGIRAHRWTPTTVFSGVFSIASATNWRGCRRTVAQTTHHADASATSTEPASSNPNSRTADRPDTASTA